MKEKTVRITITPELRSLLTENMQEVEELSIKILSCLQYISNELDSINPPEDIKSSVEDMCRRFTDTLEHDIKKEFWDFDGKLAESRNSPGKPVVTPLNQFVLIDKWLLEEVMEFNKMKMRIDELKDHEDLNLLLTGTGSDILNHANRISGIKKIVEEKIENYK